MWWGLTVLVAVSLFVFEGRNAIGGGGTLGAIVGVGVAFFQPTFEWSIVGKAIIIGALIGLVFEILPRIAKRLGK